MPGSVRPPTPGTAMVMTQPSPRTDPAPVETSAPAITPSPPRTSPVRPAPRSGAVGGPSPPPQPHPPVGTASPRTLALFSAESNPLSPGDSSDAYSRGSPLSNNYDGPHHRRRPSSPLVPAALGASPVNTMASPEHSPLVPITTSRSPGKLRQAVAAVRALDDHGCSSRQERMSMDSDHTRRSAAPVVPRRGWKINRCTSRHPVSHAADSDDDGSLASDSDNDDGLAVDRIGPYEVFGELGRGATAVVYEGVLDDDADDLDAYEQAPLADSFAPGCPSAGAPAAPGLATEPVVAIKVQRRRDVRYTRDGSMPREAWALSQLAGHPHVVRLIACVDDAAVPSDPVAFVLSRVNGKPSATISHDITGDLSPDRPVSTPSEVRAFLAQTLSVLAALERRRLVHADLKYDNVLVERRQPGNAVHCTVIDFGAAHAHQARADLRRGDASGSPATAHLGPSLIASVARDDIDAAGLVEHLGLSGGLESAQRLHQATENSFAASISSHPNASVRNGSTLPSPATGGVAFRGSSSTHPFTPGRTPAAGRGQAAQAGAPMFAAPEVLGGAAPSTASDLFALGVMLFGLVAGRLPVDAAPTPAMHEAAMGDFLEALRRPPMIFARHDSSNGLPQDSDDDQQPFGGGHDQPAASTAPWTTDAFGACAFGTAADGQDDESDEAAALRSDSASIQSTSFGPLNQARVVEALRARSPPQGTAATAWDLEGADAWVVRLIATLLHPEPFHRSTPGALGERLAWLVEVEERQAASQTPPAATRDY